MRRSITGCALAVLAVTVLVGCGSSSKSSTASSSGGNALKVAAHDFRFDPTSLTVKAGGSVKVTVHNAGSVEHNFSLAESKVNTDVPKGSDRDVSFTAPTQPGDYTYFCEYHRARGMTGTIHVTAAAASGGTGPSTTSTTRGGGY